MRQGSIRSLTALVQGQEDEEEGEELDEGENQEEEWEAVGNSSPTT